jgi:hypothetical protein
MSLILQGSTSGSVTLQEPAVAGTTVLDLPAASGTVMVSGNMPVFRAVKSGASQSFSSSTWTKVTFETETFDTNNNFASSTFTPTVAGYYQINGRIAQDYASSANNQIRTAIYKNGSIYSSGVYIFDGAYGSFIQVSDIVFCNGTTDTVEIYAWSNNSSPVISSSTDQTIFSGVLVRAS